MRIGIPTEVKPHEGRVALIPAACKELLREGNEVYVERGAGLESGFGDDDYHAVGARICADAAELYAHAELVVKVKEPVDALPLLAPMSEIAGRLSVQVATHLLHQPQ